MTLPQDLLNNLLPATPTVVPDVRDLIDATTNVIQGARYINAGTGDYALTATGHFQGMNDIQQKVMLALLTDFGSATSAIGQTLKRIRMVTPNLQSQVQGAVQSALASLLNNNQIILTQPTVIKVVGGNVVNIIVYWMDITTHQIHQSNVPITPA